MSDRPEELDEQNGEGMEDHSVEDAIEEALELDTQGQIFIELRRQNIELLKVAAEVAGLTGPHPALKPNDVRGALKNIWEIYSEFYAWIDPEEGDDEDEEYEDDEL
ncbi:MAG: hypothetical protein AB7I30_16950 [Isosphaeraceae bacterium]